MTPRPLKLVVLLALALLAVASLLPRAAAQQITYYSFDNASSAGFGCSPNSVPNSYLLCFNGNYPYISSDYYPPAVDPSNNPSGSYHNAMYLHDYFGYNESSWFSVPQDITDGFTTYFAFRINPNHGSPPADGFAFVIQNSNGSGTEYYSGLNCTENDLGGATAVGGGGGCMGYGGIDHSFAVEFDTYTNPFDPGYFGNDFISANHIALQSCGTDPNSPNHGTSEGESGCLIADGDITGGGATPQLSISMADGNVHEVVVEYGGDTEAGGSIAVYLDPPFIPGTHTPSNSATPVLTENFSIGQSMGLGTPGGVAHVGFTGATENSLAETTDILAWTFTPHTTSSQQQPLNSGAPTTFPFGQHTYTVNYPADVDTTNIDMIVDALPIAPGDFETLINEGPFNGTHCQTYEGTGTAGSPNCIIYSVHCVFHDSGMKTPCPSTSDPIIPVKTAYESDTTVTPDSPGFLQGDPLFAQISQITESGTTATVHCVGECFAPDTPPATVRLHNTTGYDGTYPVNSVVGIDSFTITHGPGDSDETGGYVTSDNVKDICNPPGDPTPCWQPNRIDGTQSGKTKNFSEFVAISLRDGPPSFTSADHSTFTTSGPNSFLVTTTSATPDTLTSSDAPAGLVIGGNNGDNSFTLSGTVAGGTYTFHLVADNGQSATQTFTLVVPALVSIAVTPVGPTTVTSGTPVQYTATGTYTDSSTQNLSSVAAWNSTVTAVATINSTGLATTANAGTTYISATYNSVTSNSPQLNVTAVTSSQISVTPTSLPFGNVNLGSSKSMTLTVKNIGSSNSLKITNITFNYGHTGSGSNYGYTTQCGGTLKPGKTCTITVTLKAQDLGPGTATLNIAYNMPGSPVVVNLSGTVINPKAKLSVGSLSFGTVKVGQHSSKTVTLTSYGDTDLLVGSIVITGSSDFTTTSCPATMPKNTTCNITVTFSPSAKQSRSGTLKITDNASSSPQTVSLTGKGN